MKCWQKNSMFSITISGNIVSDLRSPVEINRILSKTPILMFHKIDPRLEFGINALSPSRFKMHVDWLHSQGFHAITFHDILSNRALPEKTVIITFDDAYESVYHHAFPILADAGFRAIVYVITNYIGKLNTWDMNLGGICFRHMSARQLAEISEKGWEIGSHTCTHRALTRLNESQLKREFSKSFQQLSTLTPRPVISVAYPFGMQGGQVQQAAKSAGYKFACGSIRGTTSQNLFSLCRIPVYQFEKVTALKRKLQASLPSLERTKLTILGYPAQLTPLYQRFFKPELFLDP